jgi:putative oxidoreductase
MTVPLGIQAFYARWSEERVATSSTLVEYVAMNGLGLLLLRLALSAVSIAHGAHMLFGTFGGPGSGVGPGGLTQTAAQFTAMSLPGGPVALLAGSAELLGGVLLGVGYLTRWAAFALAAFTAMLSWKSQWPWGFFLNWVGEPGRGHGIEFSIVLFAGFLCLTLSGGGDFSIDGRKTRRQSYAAAGRARLRRN